MGSSTGDLLVNESNALKTIFDNTAGLIAVHAEDETRMIEREKMIEGRTDMAAHAEWRDDETALIATKRAVKLAQESGLTTCPAPSIWNRSRLVSRCHIVTW